MAEPAVKIPDTPAPSYRINRKSIHLIVNGIASAIYDITVPPEVPPSDALRPEFWSHIVQEMGLQPGNFAYVRPDDRRWTLYLEVLDVGPNWLKARKLW